MAAVRPIVLVYQDLASPSVSAALPDLNVVVVGPAYKIFDFPSEKAAISLGAAKGSLTDVASGSASAGFAVSDAVPGLDASLVFDATSTKLFVENAQVELAYGATGTIGGNNQNTFSTAGGTVNFKSLGVAAGDRLVVGDIDSAGAAAITYVAKTILSVSDDGKTLYTTTNFTNTGTDIAGAAYTGITLATASLNYRIERTYTGATNQSGSGVVNVSNPAAPVLSAASLTVTIGAVTGKVTYGTVYCQYRALWKGLSTGINEVRKLSDITTDIGKIDERNPLAVGVFVAFQNCNKRVQYIGVDSDDSVGHTTARDAISGQADVYAIVPLTTDTATLTMWRNHVVALAAPEISKLRVVIGSSVLPTASNIVGTSTSTRSGTTEVGDGTLFTLLDNSATFLTSGVAIGDIVKLTSNSLEYVVTGVLSENRLQVTKGSNAVPTYGADSYYVHRNLNRAQQVTALNAVTAGLKNSRCVMVWPDTCLVSGVANGATGLQNELPGYYVAAAVGGMVAGLPPHQGFTFIGIAGISQVKKSNTYFYDDQIDQLSSGGWYVVVQDTPTSPPYCIHQLTTDTTTLESGELNVVKNFDYVSMTIRDAVRSFLGVYNVIPTTLDFLRAAVEGAGEQLRVQTYPKIGAPLIALDVSSVAVLDGSKDRVEIYAEANLPRPLNRVGLHITA